MIRTEGRTGVRPRPRPDVERLVRTGVLFTSTGDVETCAAEVDKKVDEVELSAEAVFQKRYAPAVVTTAGIIPMGALSPKLQAQLEADKSLFDRWHAFRLDFKNWKNDWETGTVAQTGVDTGAWYTECSNYDDQVNAWIDEFSKNGSDLGVEKITPVSMTPGSPVFQQPRLPVSGSGLLDSLVTLVKWGVVGGIVVLVWTVVR